MALNASEKKPPGLSERKVRREARRIVDQLDRFMENAYAVLGCSALIAGIAAFPFCWKFLDHTWWQATLWAFGVLVVSFVAVAVIGLWLESRSWRKAVRRFDLRFPEGSPHRPIAESMVADVEPRNDAVKAFLEHVLAQPLPATAPPGGAEVATPSPIEPRRRPRTLPSAPAGPPQPQNATIPLELPVKPR